TSSDSCGRYPCLSSHVNMARMSTLLARSEAPRSCQISSVPYLHRLQSCIGTPPDPSKQAVASTGQEPLLTISCWIMASLCQLFSQMSYAASALVAPLGFMSAANDE